MTSRRNRNRSIEDRTPPRRQRGGVRVLALAVVVGLALAGATGGAIAAWRAHATPARAEEEPVVDLMTGQPVDPGARGDRGLQVDGHQKSEGLMLTSQGDAETVHSGGKCTGDAPVREYNVVAIDIDITLNAYLDHDPDGRMYVLEEDLERVRQEEEQNAAARAGQGDPAVTPGLQNDAIQPLTLRVNQGECLRVKLRNDLKDEPASFHLHDSSLVIAGTDSPAIATNTKATAGAGKSVTYEWMVAENEPEATHYFHSHGNEREQTGHGLFGAVIVEPEGSRHLDPLSGEELHSGWQAIIDMADASDFREFALYYHEVGNENYQLLDKNGDFVPLVDPFTSAYRPDARALNYRSEPFMNRLALQQDKTGRADESVSYSSYAFGDPSTPIMRSYIGDPVKERIIHGGSEVFHVHHVHGGSIRWLRQPQAGDAHFDSGLDKHPPLLPDASERTDSQGIGPSETYDVMNECGSGGCQQSVGDFLVHCHVAHHYFAGMWGLWRVYNTMQDGASSTDAMAPLQPLPDRTDVVEPAVTSDALAGKTVDWSGKQFTIDDLPEWVELQMPPQGVPKGYDASVLDWTFEGGRALNQPETSDVWPGYQSPMPGERPPLLFDPKTGKLAYPFLRPHLGARPPFAPNHGPAPYLDPTVGPDPPEPGASGPASVCPEGTRLKSFAISAIGLPIDYNDKTTDPTGELYILQKQEADVRSDNDKREPLTIRANAGEDCVDITLKSDLQDDALNHNFAKVNLHIHFVQFDVQASDGVIAGFNYEQSVRPYQIEGQRLQSSAPAGQTSIVLDDADRFQAGAIVGVGMDRTDTFEARKIASIDGDTLTFTESLRSGHSAGEIVSTEFVRYRWYPDVQFGTAYFHDHVNAIDGWRHGLIGALIAEPPGSTYHDPASGDQIESGTLADIHTDAKVSADVNGSFRELALFLQDDNSLSHVGRSSGSAINLRAEPLSDRKGEPSQFFSSAVHGDPSTPLLRAYAGDPVVMRTLVGATNDMHTLHVDGHWFRIEAQSKTSPPVDTVHLGISERYDLVIPKAGGPQGLPGDYLYYNGRALKLQEGSWGIFRVLAPNRGEVQPLPGRSPPAAPAAVCPQAALVKNFSVAAIDTELPMLEGRAGKVFVLHDDRAALEAGEKPAEPLVLHVNVGDCVKIELSNATSKGAVSLHADMLAYDPAESGGIEAGNEPPQAVSVGQKRTYTFYASPEVGETVSMLRDWGDVTANPRLGLYGAIVVGPQGVSFRDVYTNEDVSFMSSWQAVVVPASGAPYRDMTLFMQEQDESIGTHRMPYTTEIDSVVGINYRSAPFEARLEGDPNTADVFRSTGDHGDPPTPLLEAFAGDPVRVHVLSPWSEQAQVFSIEGHQWPVEAGLEGTDVVSSVQLGGMEATTFQLTPGAGGTAELPGDYVYGDHRMPYQEAGLWGLFRVYPRAAEAKTKLLHLECAKPSCSGGSSLPSWPIAIGALSIAVVLAGGVLVLRRRRAWLFN